MKYKIENLLEKVIDNRGKTPPISDKGHLLLEINCLTGDNKFPNYNVVQKIVSEETYNTWFRAGHPQKGDILIPTVGTLDALAFLDRNDCCIAQNIIAFRTNKEICDSQFLYYLLRNPIIRKKLLNLNIGGVQPSIKVPHLKQLEVDVPELETQKKIVRILSALDSKIELNAKQNETLERIAGEWIKKYQKEEDQKIKLKNIMSFDNGFAFKSKDYQEEGKYKIITIKNVQDGNVDSSGAQCMDMLPKDIKEHHELKIGDVLLSLTGNVGRAGIVFEDNLLLNQRVAKINAKKPELTPFLYFVFRQDTFKADLENLAKGTAQLNLSPVETLEKYVSYDAETALVFSGKLKPLFDKIIINKQQNKELSVIRDSLLPKLMNGEINLDKVEGAKWTM